MDAFETYRVCKNCFINTKSKSPPTLQKCQSKDGTCKTCGNEWVGIHVGYYSTLRKWCIIRPRPPNSELTLCKFELCGTCYRDERCRRAHNQLELEIWTLDEKLYMNRKRPSKPKFGCVICKMEFRDNDTLNTHLMGKQHETKAKNMCILPEVGSSIHYTGPIRARPHPHPQCKMDYYERCPNYQKNKCRFGAGCRYAHSTEELKVWTDALTAQKYQNQDRRYSNCGRSSFDSGDGSATSEGGASRYPSESVPTSQNWSKHKFSSSASLGKMEGEPEHVKEIYQRINVCGIKPFLRNSPKHIKIKCNKAFTTSVDEHKMPSDIRWVFSLVTTGRDELRSVVLCDNKKIFTLGEIFRCSTQGRSRMEIKQKFIPNRTDYFLCQSFNQDSYFEIALICKPVVGVYKAQIVCQLQGNTLVAREVKVKTRGERYKDVCDNFQTVTKQPRVRVQMVEQLRQVNWEHGFNLINTTAIEKTHEIPSYVEDAVNAGNYSMPNEISRNYVKRFHTLLYFEEFEHKRSLMRYDLPDQSITIHSAEKNTRIERGYGWKRIEATGESRFLTLKLTHRLFEGYRSFRPPKIAYIIPNGTKDAYEYNVCHMGTDYVIISIHTELIEACKRSGGLALVRFAPERRDYIQMHESLDFVRLSAYFPTHRRVDVPYSSDVDHLLDLLDYEELSIQQKEAVYSIVDTKYQSFPTIICGPFGCGKTRTLSVAARLISRCFYSARVLIVTKSSSAANLYVELLQSYFDTIAMYRNKQGNKKIMFRHFSKGRGLQLDEENVKAFANIEDNCYKWISFYELQICSVVVTNLSALASLIPPRSRHKSKSLFTHIFLDEAAQVIEPEACIALCLASDKTKIVLAGDVYQTKPLILSKYCKQYDLDESILQRFEQLPAYETDALRNCIVVLRENFRSQEAIVKLLSELFYDESLTCNPPSLTGPANYPALSFLHVSGDEQSLREFPSYYNNEEAELTILALKKFVAAGVPQDSIAVLSTHKAQVRIIHDFLKEESKWCRRNGHSKEMCIQNKCIDTDSIHVNVRNLEGVQGREYDLIIVNTVRTVSDISEDMPLEERVDLGLLDDVTQFNTILTRARGWVLVIGDMDCLLTVGDCSHVWNMYIEACDDANGLFRSRQLFENLRMENHIPQTIPKKIKRETQQNSTNPFAEIHSASPYDAKYSSLQTFISTCQQELESTHNADITQAIRKQVSLATIAMETMESQRYMEQRSILSDYQMRQSSSGSLSTGADDHRIAEPSLQQHRTASFASSPQTVPGRPHGATPVQVTQHPLMLPPDIIRQQDRK